MYRTAGTSRRGALLGLLVAVVAMALMVPSVAFAYTAKYTAASPKSGSSSRVTTPTITVTVYAPAGVKGSTNYSMYVDGVKVKPSISYSSKYRKFKLSYRRTTPLKVGGHKATVKIKDLKRHTSSYTWSFTVLAPLPPPPPAPTDMTVTIASNACLKCHLGFPASHPMSACRSCHSQTGPVPGETYGPLDQSAHTLACSLESPCHGGGGTFPHVLGSDCMSCHDGRYPAIAKFHGGFDPAAHVTTQTFCTGSRCHDSSLTIEHFKYSVNGEPLSCETCHSNPDPKIVAGVASGSTACSGCHDLTANPHPGTQEAHAYPPIDCAKGNGCHKAADVVTLHKGECAACHTPGRTLTTNCYSCHPAQPHPDFNLVHTAGPLGCTTAACHSTNVIAIHTVGVSAPGCPACHAEGQPPLTLQCETAGCHASASASHSAHPVAPAAEVISIGGVSYGSRSCADCHTPLDLIGLHSGRCLSCHGLATNATMTGGCAQTGCHASETLAKHGGIESAHRLTSTPSCVASGCHSGANAAAIHAATVGAGASAPGCAACHRAGVTPTLACGTAGCHSASDAHPIANAHPKMPPGHTAGLPSSCVKAGCHVSELTTLHAAAGGCATCHGPGKTLTKVCATAGCHSGDVASAALHPTYASGHVTAGIGCTATGCHVSNVIALHTAGASAPGCEACHAAGKPALTLACATAGCHPTLPGEHSSHPVTAADARLVFGGVDFGTHACSECHTPLELIQLHGGSCASCHAGSAPTATFIGGCAQASCHASGSLAMHGGATAAHTLATAPSCTVGPGCHSGGTNLAELHASTIAGSNAPGCAVCHAARTKPTATCATQGCHAAGDSHPIAGPHPAMTPGHTTSLPVTCVSSGCHASDAVALHAAAQGCTTCHGPGKTPAKECARSGCHIGTISSTALHPTYVTGHTAPSTGCTRVGCHVTDAIRLHTTGATAPGCKACHASGKPALTLACTTAGCHVATPAHHDGHPVAPAAETVTISGASFGSHACSECHAPLDLFDLHNDNCAACHTATGVSATFTGGCAQGSCHTSGTLLKHGTIDSDHVGDTSSCTGGTGCHAATSNIALVHKTQGCATCHGAGKTPTAVCSTSGCHGVGSSHPVSAPHPGMASAHTSGLPASCVKSGCHGADLVALHAGKNACATCHWDGKVATKECSTSGCHATLSSMHTSHPANVAPADIRINGLRLGSYACTTCHASMDLQVIHGGTVSCAKCHPDAAKAVGTWDGGCAQAACHGPSSARPMHAGVDAAHTMATQPGCTRTGCHYGNSSVGDRDFAFMHFPTAKKCENCHQPGQTHAADCASCHKNWATGDHQADHGYCNDCHAPYKWDPTKTVMGSGDPSGYPGALHWNMFDAAWTLKIGRAVIGPGYPYGDYTMLREPGVLGTPGPYSTTYMDRTVTYSCTACHEGAGKTWVHPAYNDFTCGNVGDCHEHHWLWDPAQGSASYVHYTPPSNWIVPSMRW